MKNRLRLVLIGILTSICIYTLSAQDRPFISLGLDPNILLNVTDPVGGGNLNYLIQTGFESYEEGKIGYKFGLQWEQFKAINYTSYGGFGGVTYSSPLKIRNLFLYSGIEINIIDRKGIESSRILNADEYSAWGVGVTQSIRWQNPFNLPFNLEYDINAKDRPDIRVNFRDNNKITKESIIISTYFKVVYIF